jgi:hypothetical protein
MPVEHQASRRQRAVSEFPARKRKGAGAGGRMRRVRWRSMERTVEVWARLFLLKGKVFIAGFVTAGPLRSRVCKTASLAAKTEWRRPACHIGDTLATQLEAE